MLIILSGLPGTGKTTIARPLAHELAAVYLRIDSIEQSMRTAGWPVEGEGYSVAYALAEDNLRLGRMSTLVRNVPTLNSIEMSPGCCPWTLCETRSVRFARSGGRVLGVHRSDGVHGLVIDRPTTHRAHRVPSL
jgi:DNA polymerase III delta prime subunit